MKKTTKEWLMSLKDEHRDLALANMFDREDPTIYHTLQDALYYECRWDTSPQGFHFWTGICDQLEAGTYFDAPQLTPEECTAKAKAYMYGKPLPTDAAERKTYPIYSGFIQYFPHAIAKVAHLSYKGNQQHHPDKPLHWDMDKSSDELDALMRHMIDGDWEQVAWRALANLERKLTNKCTYDNQDHQEN